MKGSCALVGSVLAASTVAFSYSSSSSGDRVFTFSSCSKQEHSHSSPCSSSPSVGKGQSKNSRAKPSAVTEKFEPKFDGLRFIETLVTAHR